jgi:hypothetical protein
MGTQKLTAGGRFFLLKGATRQEDGISSFWVSLLELVGGYIFLGNSDRLILSGISPHSGNPCLQGLDSMMKKQSHNMKTRDFLALFILKRADLTHQ